MKVNNIETGNYCNKPNFRGVVLPVVRERVEQFCSPDEMNAYRDSYMKDFYDRPMTKEDVELCDKYEKISVKHTEILGALNNCMENEFNDSIGLTVRKVKETKNKESVLALFNKDTGKIMDVSAYFDTKYGDITQIVERFIKKACSYVAEMHKI